MSISRSVRPLCSRLAATLTTLAVAMLAAPAPARATFDLDIWYIDILSSRLDQVSGGDALVRVNAPGSSVPSGARLLLNGVNVTSQLSPSGEFLEGVVSGFNDGWNVLVLRANSSPLSVRFLLPVKNTPIGGPMFSGPQQQPFVCTTFRAGLGQPIIDNQDAIGIRVAQEDASGNYPRDSRGYPTAAATIIGYSKNCAGNTRFQYWYRNTAGNFLPLASPGGPLPADITTTTTLGGQTVPYIVRQERGTSNRFIYSVAMLAPTTETSPTLPDDSLWNKRLVFSLEGGVAIGRTQGTSGSGAMLRHDSLSLGYAVVASTGLRANTHYNLELGGETALMLKEHFIEEHGVPDYTVGVGGSGGAIQQYVYAQNHPGLLDAAIPQYSYSDMITQTIHVGDCELLENYFDHSPNPKWSNVLNRRAIEGLNASVMPTMGASEALQWNGIYSIYSLLGLNRPLPAYSPSSTTPPPITECRRAWFGLTPLTLNPTFTDVADIDKLAQGTAGVDWTHTGDLVNIYGKDAAGYARNPWDNVGVQYGLLALRDGVITPDEFLDLNAKIGSWKEPGEMVAEGFPFTPGVPPGPTTFDPWSARNMSLSTDGGVTPAPRRTGSLDAIQAAYQSGMRFDGDIDIPVIDWRHYLEEQLDMHHSHQSFATRRRLQLRHDEGNQVIWFTDARPGVAFDQTPEAFAVIDEWMANIKAHPWKGVAGNKPPGAVDRCFNTLGQEIAAGDGVWDGVLDSKPPGACTQAFPLYSSSRRVAGGPFEGGVFKCGVQSVDAAIAAGVYGSWAPSVAEHDRLVQIFPQGVCDWSKRDVGRPTH